MATTHAMRNLSKVKNNNDVKISEFEIKYNDNEMFFTKGNEDLLTTSKTSKEGKHYFFLNKINSEILLF